MKAQQVQARGGDEHGQLLEQLQRIQQHVRGLIAAVVIERGEDAAALQL
jgi:hypothetical protein